jgi:hypothetical protein
VPHVQEFKDAAERAFLLNKLRENDWNVSKLRAVGCRGRISTRKSSDTRFRASTAEIAGEAGEQGGGRREAGSGKREARTHLRITQKTK